MNKIIAQKTQTNHNDIFNAIDNAPLAESTRMKYISALNNAIESGVNLTDRHALVSYANNLPTSSKSFLKAALSLWLDATLHDAMATATPDNVASIQAIEYRVQSLKSAIKVKAAKGSKPHAWLTADEIAALLDACDVTTLSGQRDRIIIGMLAHTGLRAEELANADFDDIVKQGDDYVLAVNGKGDKNRSVPLSASLVAVLQKWQSIVGSGRIARSLTKSGVIKKSITSRGIFAIVSNLGESINRPKLAPHDLRRTFAQYGYSNGVSLNDIRQLLGHSSIATTQKYLNADMQSISAIMPTFDIV